MAKPLENLMNTTIETIIEAIEKKPWTAFINNTVAFTGVIINNKGLIEDIKKVQGSPTLITEMEERAVQRFGKKYENELVSKIFKMVWAAVVFNISTVIAIDEVVREHNHDKALK